MEALKLFPLVIFVGLFVLELRYGHFSKQRGNLAEKLVSWGSYLQQFALVRPIIAFVLATFMALWFRPGENSLAHWPFWPVFFGYLFTRELMQYWYHRFSHEWPWLWKLHRTHHTAEQMNVLVTSRGNVLWFLLMPTLYYEALMIYVGLSEPYLLAYAVLAAVSLSSHSGVRWDLPLFEHRLTRPIMLRLQRIFTLPDTHHAHHGMGEESNPNGNYAPMFFFYDVWFKSDLNPQKKQSKVGIVDGDKLPWWRQLYSPFG